MIDDEEKQPAVAASPGDRESDGGDDFSHYSSCGESEFERYCSASSAMGTPSFRGSSIHDSDFGSLKSFKLGENSDFNKILGAERVLILGYRESDCGSGGKEKDNGTLNLNGGIEGLIVGGDDLRANSDVDCDWGNGVVTESEMKESADGSMRIASEVVEVAEGRIFEKASDNGAGLEIDGGEASSRCDHSEGEDSMFGCGSDDERNVNSYYTKNVPFRGEGSGMKENRVIMNSAVAFGSDDWDDFVHESSENTIDSMVWGEFQAVAKSCASPSIFNQAEYGDKLSEIKVNAQSTVPMDLVKLEAQAEGAKQVHASRNEVSDIDELDAYLGSAASVNDIFQTKSYPLEKTNEELKIEFEMENQNVITSEAISIHHNITSEKRKLKETSTELDPPFHSVVNQNDLVAGKVKEEKEVRLSEDDSSFALPLVADTIGSAATKNNLSSAFDPFEDHFIPAKKKDFELNGFYDEIVNDMEDILLDSAESPASRLTYSTRISQSQLFRPSRDGGSSASTSGTDHGYTLIHQPLKIDRVEVVGSRQRKGDVSFSERLVGVQKYTVYKIKVWGGEDQWEVERRYRDFHTLYHRLKKLFADNGWILPSSWSSVEKESRKLFGNASPDVVAERSILIQECLQSIIHHRLPSCSLNALTCSFPRQRRCPALLRLILAYLNYLEPT